MLFAIDIDGTIATDRTGYAVYLNRALDLGIPETVLDTCSSYQDFAALSVVQLYRQDSGQDARFREVRDSLEHDPEMQRQLVPIPGAVDALQEMVRDGARIVYVTCRKPESAMLTREWLAQHAFPCAETATVCEHYWFKYVAIHEHIQPREPVILIDDRGETMIKAFVRLARLHSDVAMHLVGRLSLVEFGASVPPTAPFALPFPVFTLPSWQSADLARLDEQAEQEFARRRERRQTRRAG